MAEAGAVSEIVLGLCDAVFRGPVCRYVGPALDCVKTFECCRRLGNEINFRGGWPRPIPSPTWPADPGTESMKKHLKIEPSAAVNDVLVERVRQLSEEGYDAKHDDAHTDGALALAAAAYIGGALKRGKQYGPPDGHADDVDVLISMAPWSIRYKSQRDSLVKAAALILAELERFDRAARR